MKEKVIDIIKKVMNKENNMARIADVYFTKKLNITNFELENILKSLVVAKRIVIHNSRTSGDRIYEIY